MNGSNTSYRQYLQYHANNHPSATKRAEAQALLNVVGDDSNLNGGFLSGEKHGLFGMQTRERKSNGYAASTLNRSINPWWTNSYASWRDAHSGSGGETNTNNLPVGRLGYYGGGSNRASAAQLAEYDQAIGQVEHGLGRIGNQLGVRMGNIANQYNTKRNELTGSYNKARNEYNTQTTQNKQLRRTNINNIDDQSSVGLRSLLRTLGSRGAMGSAVELAGRAVQNKANRERTGAGQTYAQNQQKIDTSWGTFQNDYKDEERKLNDWRSGEENAARQQSKTTEQNLLTQLAQLRSQKAAAQGANGANAARADLGRANALSAEIDNLGRVNNTYTGNKVNYQAKDLDTYKVDGGTAVGVTDGQFPGADPTLNAYNTKREEDEERKLRGQHL